MSNLLAFFVIIFSFLLVGFIFLIVSRLVNISLCRKGCFPTGGHWFSGVPPAATQDAQRVVINHTVTPRLLGLSATLAAWGLGTSGMSGYIGRGGGAHLSRGDSEQTFCLNLPTPPPTNTNALLTFKVPGDAARTKSEHTHYMTRNTLRCSEQRKAVSGDCTSMTIRTSPHNASVGDLSRTTTACWV